MALPGNARQIWDKVPAGLFHGRAGQAIARAVDALLEGQGFSAVGLARQVEDPDASRIAVKVLSRLEGDESAGGSRGGASSAGDHELVWSHCLRDLRRWEVRARLGELESRKARAREAGDQEAYQACRLESARLLKELKRRS
jgi:hypothetical protein